MAHHYHEDERNIGGRQGANRVLTGLPARLDAAKTALREHEKTLEQLRQLYGQRLVLKDSVVLDQIGDLLGCPPLKGDNTPKRGARAASTKPDCPACTGSGPGYPGEFCNAHDWLNKT